MESIFTSPDLIYLQQEDEAITNPLSDKNAEENEEEDTKQEPFMYFIRTGKFSVNVKIDHINPSPSTDSENAPRPVQSLIDGDHFGEIGMLFECRRSATVQSEQYGRLALLKKSHFTELSKTFESFSSLFKKQIFKYQDELTLWLMLEMDKIPYFRELTLQTK